MSKQEKGGFRPPPLGNVLWRCTACGTFNAKDAEACKKCGAPKVIDETIAGATYEPIDDSERHLKQ
jgi:rubrerythrin